MSRDQSLVDADWVQQHVDDASMVIAEVDEDVSAYDAGHIPGAVKLDWKNDLQDPVRRDFVDQKRFEELMSERGITPDHTVVLYGGNNNWFAAYAYWYFKVYGHERVRLLDGGRKIWELQLRPLTDEVPQRPRTGYTAKEPDYSIRAFRDEVLASVGQQNQNLIDVRSPRSSQVSCWPPPICRRSRHSAVVTSPVPETSPGPRRPTTTAPSRQTRNSGRSTSTQASTLTATPSPTAGSASAAPTPGSSSTNCSTTPT